MRRRLSILTLICCSLLCTMVGISGVQADTGTDGSSGNPNSGNSCSGSLCYSSATGIRITLVDQNGNRCYKSGNDYCVSSSTKNAQESKSIDYWYSASDLPSYNSYCVAYNTKRTKSEFIRNLSTSGVVDCTNASAYGKIYDLNQIGFPEIGTSSAALINSRYLQNDKEIWKDYDVTEARRLPTNIGNIVNFFQCSQDLENDNFTPKEFNSNNTINCSYKDSTVRKVIGDKIINNIIRNAYDNDQLTITNNTNNNMYLQVEQLIAFNMMPGTYSSYMNKTVFMGTVAEVAYLYNNYYNETFKYRYILLGTKFNNNGFYYSNSNIQQIADTSSAIHTGIMNGFYAKSTTATGMRKVSQNIDVNTFLNDTFEGSMHYIKNPKDSIKNILKKYYQNDTANIFSIWLNDALSRTCHTEATNIVKEHCKNGVCNDSYISALASNDKTSKCVKDGSIKSECNALDPQNIKLYNGVKSGLTDACSQIECTTLAQDVFNKYKKTSNQIGVENSDYENYISWLYGIYKENLLVTSFWRDILEKSAPTCSTEKPECPPGNSGSISNCDANTTFSDSVDLSCWQKNIAYNNADNPLDYSAYQTSKDLNFSGSSDDGCKVYCKETVSFDLPNENGSYKTKSSKIFKWGKDNDISNSTFGTMKVKRICQVVQTGSGGVCDKTSFNPVYWVKNKIDTTITLMYNEPVSGRNVKDVKLKANFKDATININGLSTTSANSDNNSHTCAGNCGDRLSKEFTVTANYSFEYGSDLHWYTDEGNGDKLITESLLDKDNMNKYSELGYGLPTEFTSPTVSYTTYNDESGYTWLATAKETQGYMYAVIQNIGTKNNDGTYHFDALIKTKSKDNNTGFNSNGSLTYGCDYSIKNEMFGTECVGSDDDPDYCSPDTSPKGIDVVFRTIELINDEEEISKAFPGMSGNGREKGANWAKLTNDQIVQILNTSIYNKKEDEQMYHITLNVATIQKIRQWNKNARKQGIDPYTDMTALTDEQNKDDENDSYGYTGYVFRNQEKNGEVVGKYVISKFLGQLYRDGDLKTICFTGSGTTTNHIYKCQQ